MTFILQVIDDNYCNNLFSLGSNPAALNETFYWNDQLPGNGGNENPNQNEVETFFEIGLPVPRIKRSIKFPDDDDENNRNKYELIGSENNTIADVEIIPAANGRASKQMIQSVTKIDVGPQSQLFVAPGSTSVIYFEVTNLRNEPTYHNFNAQDEKRFLRQMEPRL